MTDLLPVVVVHGGAGFVPKERMELSISGVCAAVRTGYAILKGGGSSMDAVVEAVSQMENNPAFNAGNGETQNFIKYFHLLYICMYMNIYMYVYEWMNDTMNREKWIYYLFCFFWTLRWCKKILNIGLHKESNSIG